MQTNTGSSPDRLSEAVNESENLQRMQQEPFFFVVVGKEVVVWWKNVLRKTHEDCGVDHSWGEITQLHALHQSCIESDLGRKKLEGHEQEHNQILFVLTNRQTRSQIGDPEYQHVAILVKKMKKKKKKKKKNEKKKPSQMKNKSLTSSSRFT